MSAYTLVPHSWYVGALHAYTTNADEAAKMAQHYPVVALYNEDTVEALTSEIGELTFQIEVMRMPASERIKLIEGD